ncbi:hypothetical protein HPB50_023990 [Hyalomma asiaticum]|uniref:Uncharacterized protein n=1 Tax=Hyalomma asiaticum TaxID=266040 RepID=A0ACB7S9Z1_HYAAI|nr:hypothetical protein HPB50_023990 [Hyalomma asiaticum]
MSARSLDRSGHGFGTRSIGPGLHVCLLALPAYQTAHLQTRGPLFLGKLPSFGGQVTSVAVRGRGGCRDACEEIHDAADVSRWPCYMGDVVQTGDARDFDSVRCCVCCMRCAKRAMEYKREVEKKKIVKDHAFFWSFVDTGQDGTITWSGQAGEVKPVFFYVTAGGTPSKTVETQ